MKNRNYVFQSPYGDEQILVELWSDEEHPVEAKIRDAAGDVWSVPFTLIREEGDEVQLVFEEES